MRRLLFAGLGLVLASVFLPGASATDVEGCKTFAYEALAAGPLNLPTGLEGCGRDLVVTPRECLCKYGPTCETLETFGVQI